MSPDATEPAETTGSAAAADTAADAPAEGRPARKVTPVSVVDPGANPVLLRHAAVELALHRLRDAGPNGETGRPLLCVHGLGEATGSDVRPEVAAWPGPIWGLDLTGHGASTVPGCGGYTVEVLVGDLDHALGHLGETTVYGRGLGAYVALLAAGARAELVRGVILADGPGIDGGGPGPHSPMIFDPMPDGRAATAPDPYALVELSADIRPPDYAAVYARQAVEFSGLAEPVYVAAVVRPRWLAAVIEEPGVVTAPLPEALQRAAAAG